MSIYKLICSDTNKIYYGQTKNTLDHRLSKGHYNCACQDFVNPTIHLVENCEEKDLLDRELYYINHFECINISGKGNEKPNRERYKKKKAKQMLWLKKVKQEQKFHCSLCNVSFPTEKRLNTHKSGFRHTLKEKCFDKYGENWERYYLKDNRQRYNNNRKSALP
tara:strand:+ start:341 stop:832 length:492 start_codon:yes stop_codon:yes gene_type:complete